MPDRNLIQSNVLRRYFVSTIYRQSSSMMGGMFYETLAWEWNDKTQERGEMIHMDYRGAHYRAAALVDHAAICARLAERHPEFTEDDEEESAK